MKHACGNNYSTIPIMQSHIWCTQLFFRTWHFQILNCSSEVESSLKSTTICRSWPRVQQPLLESFPVRLRASLPALLAFSPSPLHVSSSPVPWYLWRFARLGFTKTSCASAARRSSSRRRSASPKNKLRSNLRKPVSIKEKSMKKCLVLSMSNNADKLYSCTVLPRDATAVSRGVAEHRRWRAATSDPTAVLHSTGWQLHRGTEMMSVSCHLNLKLVYTSAYSTTARFVQMFQNIHPPSVQNLLCRSHLKEIALARRSFRLALAWGWI